jgi:excinuclease ABC subunit B
MYADQETTAMQAAIRETNRRRQIQVEYNRRHGITPETIKKGISDIAEFLAIEDRVPRSSRRAGRGRKEELRSPEELERLMVELEEEMLAAAEELRFEYAAKLRDEIKALRHEYELAAGGASRSSGG